MDYLLQIQKLFQNYYTNDFIYRPFVKADTFPLFEATKNPEFNRYLLWNAPKDISELSEQVEMLLREQSMNQATIISICEKNNGQWIGFIKLIHYENNIEMSFWIHPNYWKSHFPNDSLNTIIQIIFSNIKNLQGIYAKFHHDNIKVQKLALKYNFIYQKSFNVQHKLGHFFQADLYFLSRENYPTYSLELSYF
jgi:RimJ/RimL family protein N-acetyltransferase